jgi:hypothetical protein
MNARRNTVALLLSMYWLVFWAVFVAHSKSPVPTPPYEDVQHVYAVFGRFYVVSGSQLFATPLMQTAFWLNLPLILTWPLTLISQDGYAGGCNALGLRLMIVFVASYAQWLIVGSGINRLLQISRRRGQSVE